MPSLKTAVVKNIVWTREGLQCLEIELEKEDGEKDKGEKKARALNYPLFGGEVAPGHRVLLNTTAVELGLGSGGYHFVLCNLTFLQLPLVPRGHIMKLRYTPLQFNVQSWEEFRGDMGDAVELKKYAGMENVPVVLAELHSMLAPFVLALKLFRPQIKIVYVMTDTASLPLPLSDTVHFLKEKDFLEGTITCGHAFGGDLETVNIFTGLMAARDAFKADTIIVAPGPGVVGTGTRYGFSGIEQGENVDRVYKLGGIPFFMPRMSFADPRPRHRGISHHTLTSLKDIASSKATVPLPVLDSPSFRKIFKQLKEASILGKHRFVAVQCRQTLQKVLDSYAFTFQSMGREAEVDPYFFASAVAAAMLLEKSLTAYH